MAVIFQNPGDARPDRDVYRDELCLADLAEPLGFDSIWSVEHHFTDYTMVPDVLQFLSYLAGRTRRVQLGSMVVVLPWHDPLRVAEQVALLDNLSDGRLLFGIGRGAGRVEFEGFGVPMSESRERFVESAEMILRGLEKGFCEASGKFVQQTRKPLRPAPFRSFRGRTYAAAVSPESVRIMAELGVGILIIPQKPWETTAAELTEYRTLYRALNGDAAPPTIAACWTFCDLDESRAREQAERWIGGYWRTVLRHYELGGDHFARERGYEFYGRMSEAVARHGADGVTDFFLNLQVWGTPEQCFDKVKQIRALAGCDTFVGVFSYAGMPAKEAERNARLFAKEVMPELQRLARE
jgi:alkanesulfonate monooxygenase SsuD/methylene tetrahydromethanopterin reductase-like flavin-dependent oxidoreductase (luciferase family)